MSLKIEITAHPDFGDLGKQIADSMRALGYERHVTLRDVANAAYDAGINVDFEVKPKPYEETGIDEAINTQDAGDYQPGDEVQVEHDEPQTPPVRERGKPSPGKRKRTAAEIAEDEAEGTPLHSLKSATNAIGEATAAISTGDERAGPEDAAAVAEADAADEAAEAEATSKGELTLDDLRAAMGRYQKKFGMAAATTDIPALLGCAPTELDPSNYAKAIEMIEEVIGKGEVEKAAEPVASKDDVVKAMLTYVTFADGPSANPKDAETMPKANEDFGKLFTMVFGPGITKLSHIPATPEAWGKTLAGIQEMQEKDPFGRGAK